MKACRECRREISEQAMACPHCGTPFPAREKWDGFGFEYKSKLAFLSWPLLHISFKYRPNRVPVSAKGIIAIGQFACGGLVSHSLVWVWSAFHSLRLRDMQSPNSPSRTR
ncbi:MAG TPA: hypothetical protein VGW77_00330 [Candidatus Binatia bacterium]|jgi:uncharacterized membrane protein YvbJ|nr:hypothetical protein [Candidatus Binatia bacterium]